MNEEEIQEILYIFRSIHLLLTACALVGTTVLLAVIVILQRRAKLRITTTIALCVLLSVDLLYLLVNFVSYVYRLNTGEFIRDLNSISCRIHDLFYWISLALQGYIQVVVSIERVIAIVSPLNVKRIVTKRRMIIVLITVIGFVVTCQSLYVVYVIEYSFTYACGVKPGLGRTLDYVDNALIRCGVPLLILVSCSACIIYYLIKARRSLPTGTLRRKSQEVRLGIVMVIIDIVFILSTLPHVIIWIHGYTTKDRQSLNTTSLILLERITNEMRGLGAITDWVVLLFLGGRTRAAFLRAVTGGLCVRRRTSFQTRRLTLTLSRRECNSPTDACNPAL